MIGTTVSHYKIVERLGSGGMSIVYIARDMRLDRFVALKFLPPGLAEDENTRNRFTHEAKAASVLDHVNICTIHDIGETDSGQLFIVMTNYEGETLRRKLERGPLPYREAIQIALKIAKGLRHAHGKGIVHRDIKPANIMITDQGEVKILDFGLAKVADQTRLTDTGSKLGTVAYMSPEQIQGIEVDHRTDLWSLGIVLYEMLTGELPYRSESTGAVLNAILNEDVSPPSGRRKDISPFLDRIVLQAVRRNPSNRYQHADQIIHDLDSLLKDETSPGLNILPKTSELREHERHLPSIARPVRALLSAIILLAMVIVIYSQFFHGGSWPRLPLGAIRSESNRRVASEQPVSGRIHEIPGMPRGIIKPAFAPSGDLLAVIAADGSTGRHILNLAKIGTGELLPLVPEMDVRGPSPEFTPDGNHIIFTSYSGDSVTVLPDVWQVTVLGGRLEKLIEHASAADLSGDDSRLVYASVTPGGTQILIRDPDGSILRLAELGYWPRWSSNGTWIAYTSSNPEGGNGHLFTIRPDGSDRRQLTRQASQLYGLCWVPNSDWIVYSCDIQGAFGRWAASVHGELIQLTRGPGECTQPAVSPDGTQIAFVHGIDATTIYLAETPADEPIALVTRDGILSASLSPRGEKVALVLGGRTRDPSISILDIANGDEHTVSSLNAWRVRWSREGQALLVAGFSSGTRDNRIWRIPVDGSLPVSVSLGTQDRVDWPDVSPDGRYLCLIREVDARSELVIRDIELREERVVATAPFMVGARWSPKEPLIAWSGGWRPADTMSGGIWVVSADGTGKMRLTTDGAYPVWDSNGKSILFTRYAEFAGLWRIGRDGGEPEQIRDPIEAARSFTVDALDKCDEDSTVLMLVNKSRDALFMMEDLNL